MTKIIHLKEQSDVDLIKAYKNGSDVIGELYNRYKHLVYGSCLKHFKNKHEAEDAVSEIFILLSKKLKTHEVENFKSWLYTVTRNYCIEVLRKESRHRDKKNDAESMYSSFAFHPDDVKDEVLLKKLAECMELLPDKQKATVDLFYFKKESYKKIADEMQISWDKVRSLMQNGRRNLKNCLESTKKL